MESQLKSTSLVKGALTIDQLFDQYVSKNEKAAHGIYFIQYDGSELFEPYEELYRNAKQILGTLQKRGFQKGFHVIFQINNNLYFMRLFWACILGGIIPVPLSVPLTASSDTEAFQKLIKVSEQISDAWIISDQANLNLFKESYLENNLNFVEFEELCLGQTGGKCVIPNAEDVAYIQYSSGSTGNPKGVKLTHKNLVCNLNQITERLNIKKADVMGSWIPLTHDMGMVGFHLTPIFAGISQFHLDPSSFMRKPWLYLQKISALSGTIIVSPNFGLEWMINKTKEAQLKTIDLSTIRALICGAEPISMNIVRQFYQKFTPFGLRDKTIFQVYGMAEACIAITIPLEGHNKSVLINRHKASIGEQIELVKEEDKRGSELAVLGQPLTGIELEIVNDEDLVLPENHMGNIVVKGPNIFQGYTNQDSQPFNKRGFFCTGDVGFICDGQLIIAGRKKDMLSVNGQNYYASDLESMLKQALPQLPQLVVCAYYNKTAGKEGMAIFVHYRGEKEKFLPIARQIEAMVLEQIGIVPAMVLPIKTIPKTTSGKVQRYRLAEQLFDQILDEQHWFSGVSPHQG